MRTTDSMLAAILAAAATSAEAERLFGLTPDNRIITFESANPAATLSSRAVNGLVEGDRLTGLDRRPANGRPYSLSMSGRIHELNRTGSSCTATIVGVLGTLPQGNAFGVDFSPVPDRLRVVSDSGRNLCINVDGGATLVDGMIMSDIGPVMLVAAAYTSNVAGAPTTTLFALDAVNGQLLRSINPDGSLYTGMNMMGQAISRWGSGSRRRTPSASTSAAAPAGRSPLSTASCGRSISTAALPPASESWGPARSRAWRLPAPFPNPACRRC